MGFFPRLAILQKCTEITENDDANSDEVVKEQLVQHFETEAKKQISLHHPLIYDKRILCGLFAKKEL